MNPQITHESGVDSHSPAGARVETWLNGPIKTGSPWAGLCLPPISPPGDQRSTYNFPLKSIARRGGGGGGGWGGKDLDIALMKGLKIKRRRRISSEDGEVEDGGENVGI